MATLQAKWENVQQQAWVTSGTVNYYFVHRIGFLTECAKQRKITLDTDALKELQTRLLNIGSKSGLYFAKSHDNWSKIFPTFQEQASTPIWDNLPTLRKQLQTLSNRGKTPDTALQGVVQDMAKEISKFVQQALLAYDALASQNKFLDAIRDSSVQNLESNTIVQALASLKAEVMNEVAGQVPLWYPDGDPPQTVAEYIKFVGRWCKDMDTALTGLIVEYHKQVISHLLAIKKACSGLIQSIENRESPQSLLDHFAIITSERNSLNEFARQASNIKPVPRPRRQKSGIVKSTNFRLSEAKDSFTTVPVPFDGNYEPQVSLYPWIMVGISTLDFPATKGTQLIGPSTGWVINTAHTTFGLVAGKATKVYRVSLPWLEVPRLSTFATSENAKETIRIGDDTTMFKKIDPSSTYRISFAKPFSEPPDVCLWLRGFEINTPTDDLQYEICPFISKYESNGFDVKFTTSATQAAPVASVTIQWLAMPKNTKGFAIGTTKPFEISPTTPSVEQKVAIPEDKIAAKQLPPPGVFVALQQFRAPTNQNFRPWLDSKVEQSGDGWNLTINARLIGNKTQAMLGAIWIVTD